LDGIPDILPNQFMFFRDAGTNSDIRKAYEIMQNQYVFRLTDRIEFDNALKTIDRMRISLSKNKAWLLSK